MKKNTTNKKALPINLIKTTIICMVILISIINKGSAQMVNDKLSATTISSEQTVTVILSNENTNDALQEGVKLNWKKCKYEFATLDEIAEKEKLGDYYLLVRVFSGSSSSGASTNYAYTSFGIPEKDLTKAFKKYKEAKNKNNDVKDALILKIMGRGELTEALFDPQLVNFNLSGASGITINLKGSSANSIQPKEILDIMVMLNIKTTDWLLNNNDGKYFDKKNGTGPMHAARNIYNSNSSELKKMTLLVTTFDTKKMESPDYWGKNFEINEFKKHYKNTVKIENVDKIKEYLKNDKESKYALLQQSVYGRETFYLITRFSDGAILYGTSTEQSFPGYKTKTYSQFDDIAK